MSGTKNRLILYVVTGFALIVLLSWYFSNIFFYLTISLVLATILKPMTNYLSMVQFYGIRMPRAFAVIISFSILSVFVTSFLFLFIPLITEQIQVLAGLNYDFILSKITTPLQYVEAFLIDKGLVNEQEGFLLDESKQALVSFIGQVDFSEVLNSLISFTGGFFISAVAIIFVTFFFLYEKGLLRNFFISLIPNSYFEVSIAAFYKIEKLLSNYLLGLLFQMFSIFSIASLGLSILGIKYAITIAVFAAVANLIPYLGPILGATFGILVGVSTSPELVYFNDYLIFIVKIVSVFATVQVTDNLVLQPVIFSKSVKAHPLEIFIIIFVGATLAGIVGMIGAIPVYTVLRVTFIELREGIKEYKIFKS